MMFWSTMQVGAVSATLISSTLKSGAISWRSNLDSVFLGCKAAAPLPKSGWRGLDHRHFLNQRQSVHGPCSRATALPEPGMTVFSKCVAQHFLKRTRDVGCNTVHRSPIETPNFKRPTAAEDAGASCWRIGKRLTRLQKLRKSTVEDIGEVVAFLARDEARYSERVRICRSRWHVAVVESRPFCRDRCALRSPIRASVAVALPLQFIFCRICPSIGTESRHTRAESSAGEHGQFDGRHPFCAQLLT